MESHRTVCLDHHLFSHFLNDLSIVSKRLTFFLFANDVNVYNESSSILDIQKFVNRELKKVRKLCEPNCFAPNIVQPIFYFLTQNKSVSQINIKFGRKK